MNRSSKDADVQKGAVEGNTPDDPATHHNPLGPAVSPEGMPSDPVATAQDRVGVNAEDPEISQSSETGKTADAPREEEKPLV